MTRCVVCGGTSDLVAFATCYYCHCDVCLNDLSWRPTIIELGDKRLVEEWHHWCGREGCENGWSVI